jgi:hypothetical protein
MPLGLSTEHTSKGASEKIRTAQRQRVKDAMDAGFARSQELVPQDRGTLLQSGFPPEWDNAGTLRWGYAAAHAWPMEKGTEPFQPPVQPLLEWSERVTGDQGLGWYVATEKIPTEGIDAQPYAQPGADKTRKWLESNSFADYLDREL